MKQKIRERREVADGGGGDEEVIILPSIKQLIKRYQTLSQIGLGENF